jgi:hypothetical protein
VFLMLRACHRSLRSFVSPVDLKINRGTVMTGEPVLLSTYRSRQMLALAESDRIDCQGAVPYFAKIVLRLRTSSVIHDELLA